MDIFTPELTAMIERHEAFILALTRLIVHTGGVMTIDGGHGWPTNEQQFALWLAIEIWATGEPNSFIPARGEGSYRNYWGESVTMASVHLLGMRRA